MLLSGGGTYALLLLLLPLLLLLLVNVAPAAVTRVRHPGPVYIKPQ
jgi:hypothetical protein